MPQALAFIAPTVFGAGGSIALYSVTAAGVASLTGAGVFASIGGSLLLSAASNALSSGPASVDPENIKLNLKQPTGERIRHCGYFRAGGTVTFFRTRGGKFYRVIAHGEGQIDGVESFILNGKVVARDGSGFVTDDQYQIDGEKLVQIKFRSGTSTSSHYSDITDIWPEYDSSHQLKGVVTTLTIAESADAENQRAVYPNNEPSLEIIGRGLRAYDPRTAATAWTGNAALIIADHIRHADGFNRPDDINMDYLAAAADDYDDEFALAAGGTEPRARLSGSWSLAEQPGTVLKRMQASCRARVKLLPDASIGIVSNKWVVPTVTLSRSQIIEILEWDGGAEQKDIYTELPFIYVDPDLGFQSVTGDPWVDTAREADNGQAAIGPQQDYTFSPSHAQCRRMAQDQIEWDNPAVRIKVKCQPSAREVMFDDFINVDMDELPYTYWRVEDFNLDLTTNEVTLSLASYNPPVWSNTLEGEPQSLPTPDIEVGIPSPTGGFAAGVGVAISQNNFAAGVGVVWDARPSSALSAKVSYRLASSTDEAIDVPVSGNAKKASIQGLADGRNYLVSISYETNDGLRSDPVILAATAIASADPPDAPTTLNVTDQGGGEALISLRTSQSENLWKTKIYRDGTLVATLSDPSDKRVTFVDTSGAGSFVYTARSVNVSNVINTSDAATSPTSTTIT